MNYKKYLKYKHKYFNLKSIIGGNPYSITDPNLDYYHKKYEQFNSSVTFYGENHEIDYNSFLSDFIDAIYSTDRKQIIILEKNKLELPDENQMARMLMINNDDKQINISRKKMLIRIALSPILYFSIVYKYEGILPNSEIICGDIRLKKLFYLIIELNNITQKLPDEIINIELFTKYKEAWQDQLDILISPEYLPIKENINLLLETILETMTNKQVEQISDQLNVLLVNLSNISMLQYIKHHIEQNVDIILFIGKLHMQNLIEEIEKLYPIDTSESIPTLIDTGEPIPTQIVEIASPPLSNQDDNFDHNLIYRDYWFFGKIRLTIDDIHPDIYYTIRFKNQLYSFPMYKFIRNDGDKVIFEHAPWFEHDKLIKLDRNNIYLYELY